MMNANCASCHSASMVLLQPKLSREQWTGIVRKMRDVYRAPVADEDVPAIIDYLAKLSPR
ncbi:c-type cytochrome [Rhizorhabdus histidinilytica]